MKVVGLDGKSYVMNSPNPPGNRARSSGHLAARLLLGQEFPGGFVWEEASIPGRGRLSLDFFVPSARLAVEVQGKQHSVYSVLLHKSPSGFAKARERDELKREWCRLNSFCLLELWDDSRPDWPALLRAARAFGPDTLGD